MSLKSEPFEPNQRELPPNEARKTFEFAPSNSESREPTSTSFTVCTWNCRSLQPLRPSLKIRPILQLIQETNILFTVLTETWLNTSQVHQFQGVSAIQSPLVLYQGVMIIASN